MASGTKHIHYLPHRWRLLAECWYLRDITVPRKSERDVWADKVCKWSSVVHTGSQWNLKYTDGHVTICGKMYDQSSCCVLCTLQWCNGGFGQTSQYCIAVVQSAVYERISVAVSSGFISHPLCLRRRVWWQQTLATVLTCCWQRGVERNAEVAHGMMTSLPTRDDGSRAAIFLRGVYSDTTQLNSTSSWVEFRRRSVYSDATELDVELSWVVSL